ncbi:hypothetical protein ACS0TY_014656 [Phlomoides rotata]
MVKLKESMTHREDRKRAVDHVTGDESEGKRVKMDIDDSESETAVAAEQPADHYDRPKLELSQAWELSDSSGSQEAPA